MTIFKIDWRGVSRKPVVVIGPWAFKIARGKRGRRCNRFEADLYHRVNSQRRAILCPVLWCSPCGALLIMRSAVPLTQTERDDSLKNRTFPSWNYRPGDESEPFEYKASDWGWLNGKLVALDYAAPALFPGGNASDPCGAVYSDPVD